MGTLNDEILRVTTGPTVQDGLKAWFGGDVTLGVKATVQDREAAWLDSKLGVETSTIQDMWLQYLASLLITAGTLNDRLLVYWTGTPIASPLA